MTVALLVALSRGSLRSRRQNLREALPPSRARPPQGLPPPSNPSYSPRAARSVATLEQMERLGSGGSALAAEPPGSAPGKHRLKLFGKLGRGAFGTV